VRVLVPLTSPDKGDPEEAVITDFPGLQSLQRVRLALRAGQESDQDHGPQLHPQLKEIEIKRTNRVMYDENEINDHLFD
jgi:hypothetical protein